jgi:hypothetical protein
MLGQQLAPTVASPFLRELTWKALSLLRLSPLEVHLEIGDSVGERGIAVDAD